MSGKERAKMQLLIIYNKEQGETLEEAEELKWFIELSRKDFDGDFRHPNVYDTMKDVAIMEFND
jgi:hypothetical protein